MDLEQLAQQRLYRAEGNYYSKKLAPKAEDEYGFYQGFSDGFHQVLLNGQIISGNLETSGGLGLNSKVMIQRAQGGRTLFYAMP
jgi:hypothetical protein